MCKVFAMTNMANVKVNAKFLTAVKDQVCKYSDKDGFGYALLGERGTIGGERSFKPTHFRPLQSNPNNKEIFKLPVVSRSSDFFGQLDLRNPKALIAHGRLSTNTVSLRNTHPFTNGELALVHNGVVSDPTGQIKNLNTNCDTEILLRYWERGGAGQVEKNVSGYYAVAVLDKQGFLHILKDDRANLYISYSSTVDSYIIATTSDIIEGIAREMKWKVETPEEMLDNKYIVFNGNDVISHADISPRGTGRTAMTAAESKALGYKTYELGEDDFTEDIDTDGWYKDEKTNEWKMINPKQTASSGSSTSVMPKMLASGFSDGGGDETATTSYKEVEPIHEDVPDYREEQRDEFRMRQYNHEVDLELMRQMQNDEMPFSSRYNELDHVPDRQFSRTRIKGGRQDTVDRINNSLKKARKA